MTLKDLLQGWLVVDDDREVTGLALDSRKVVAGNVFVALAGFKQHGLLHAQQAIANGAQVILYDPADNGQFLAKQIEAIPVLPLVDLHQALGGIASRFYGQPSQQLEVIGITGTNGKTSCSHLLSQLLNKCGIIGTLGWGEKGKLHATLNTTPDALAVQHILSELLKEGKQGVAMEVSSHALEQGRVNGIQFKGVVFTNISQDHLDYHGTMEAYFQTKLTLLDKSGIQFAVVNLDDSYSDRIIERIPNSVVAWGISTSGRQVAGLECLGVKDVVHSSEGISFTVHYQEKRQPISVSLYGDFNIENILTTLAVSLAMGTSLEDAAKKLQLIQPIPGRMEPLGGGILPLIFIDYAHTPDALDKVLTSVRKHCSAALWVVFGCGGNRDTGKRAKMGSIAEQKADYVIVTDDNPRFENSLTIIKDITSACCLNKAHIIQDRKAAIQHAILNATEHDCIVVAGKGHETYQDINGIKIPFNDRQIVIDALNTRIVNL